MKSRILTISRATSGNANYPFINISGKWLKDNGFVVGERESLLITKREASG